MATFRVRRTTSNIDFSKLYHRNIQISRFGIVSPMNAGKKNYYRLLRKVCTGSMIDSGKGRYGTSFCPGHMKKNPCSNIFQKEKKT